MFTKTLTVSAIENGTVIDHISPGQALKIISLLQLIQYQYCISIGVYLKSESMEIKDIIKIHSHELSDKEANQIAIFAPYASISIIKSYEVNKKFKVNIPKKLIGVLGCPNPHCVSNHESIPTRFTTFKKRGHPILHCDYCEKTFTHNEVQR